MQKDNLSTKFNHTCLKRNSNNVYYMYIKEESHMILSAFTSFSVEDSLTTRHWENYPAVRMINQIPVVGLS